jgi:hypothetical protein
MAKKTTARRKSTREIGPEHIVAAIGSMREQLEVICKILESQPGSIPTLTLTGGAPGNPCVGFPVPWCGIPFGKEAEALMKRKLR